MQYILKKVVGMYKCWYNEVVNFYNFKIGDFMKDNPKKEKRLSVDIPERLHQQLKYIGVIRNCSMRTLILRALISFIKYESKFN